VRAAALVSLVGRDLRRSMRTFWVAALGIAAGVATLVFFLGLAAGMRAVVFGKILPLDQVEVIPPESSVGSVLSMLGARPPGIDEEQARALRRAEGVRLALPRLRLAFPTSGRGGRAMFGRDVGSGEIPADGVDPSMVLGDLRAGADFEDPIGRASNRPCAYDADCGAASGEFCDLVSLPVSGQARPAGHCSPPIPAVVSPYLVEVFNGAIAPAHNLPRLGDLLLRQAEGLILEWDLGRAGLGAARQGTPRRVHAKLVGVSARAMDLGVTIPMAVARRLNREYASEDAATRYSSVVVYLRDPSRMTEVAARVRAEGLEVRTRGAEQMGLLATAVTVILSLASVVTVLVAALNIAHGFAAMIAERRGELGLLRALGATRRDVRLLLVLEAAAIGAGATALGLAAGRAAAWGCDVVARTRLPDFPFKPDTWFVFSGRMVLGVLLFGVAACVLAALRPAWRAAKTDPAAALSGGVG
jgi:ABC-type lipoprotein release transport system permease subunit